MRLKIFVNCVGVLLSLWAFNGQAADGVLEINQACAINGGCFDGDTAGFPVTITQPGSYLLTGNLSLEKANDTGILVDSRDVTINLNGFTIRGITICTGVPVASCSPAADPIHDAGYGVTTPQLSPRKNVTVMHGTVSNLGYGGINLSSGARVIDVRAISNSDVGISVLGDSVVRGCSAVENGRMGINVNRHVSDPPNSLTLIQDNVSSGNGQYGVIVSNIATLVIGNVMSNNGDRVLSASSSGYSKNVFLNNGGGPSGVSLGDNLCDGVIC